MSSITKAAARPVSTIWKASGWPFAEMMFKPRFCAALISVIPLMLVVPAVETTVLPFRSCRVLRFADVFATQRLAVTQCVLVDHTCPCRGQWVVHERHATPIRPFVLCGMLHAARQRDCATTGPSV